MFYQCLGTMLKGPCSSVWIEQRTSNPQVTGSIPVGGARYRHKTLTPLALESTFHDLLKAAGHIRAPGKNAGRDWYATNLEFLDAVGSALECEIAENRPPEDI